ncbi:hypothetical protein GIB67_039090, partial [Kingdonia uniflora]
RFPHTQQLSLSLYTIITPSLSSSIPEERKPKAIVVSKGSHCTKRNYCTRGNPNLSTIPKDTLFIYLSSRCKYYVILFLL